MIFSQYLAGGFLDCGYLSGYFYKDYTTSLNVYYCLAIAGVGMMECHRGSSSEVMMAKRSGGKDGEDAERSDGGGGGRGGGGIGWQDDTDVNWQYRVGLLLGDVPGKCCFL